MPVKLAERKVPYLVAIALAILIRSWLDLQEGWGDILTISVISGLVVWLSISIFLDCLIKWSEFKWNAIG